MELSDRDRSLLDGAEGEGARLAMEALVALGRAFDAPDMVDIGYAHVHPGMALYKGDVEMMESLSRSGATFGVPVSVNIANADVGNWQATGAPESVASLQGRAEAALYRMKGPVCFTCTPYWAGHWPTWNMHVASIESGVTVFSNSVLGARANRDGFFATYAGITGRYPRFGLHLDQNRRPTVRVVVRAAPEGTTDFTALGYAIGATIGSALPLISGLGRRPNLDELDALGVGMATSGGVSMFILPGVTPPFAEEADVGANALAQTVVDDGAMRSVYETFATGDPAEVDLVHIGCPHASYEELRHYARLLDGRVVREDVELWITTNRNLRAIASDSGVLAPIIASGAKVISDTCPMSCHFARTVSPDERLGVVPPAFRTILVDSAKQAHYVRDMIQCRTLLTSTERAVEFAVTRRYRPRFP